MSLCLLRTTSTSIEGQSLQATKLMNTFGWIDTLWALIVPWIFTAYGTFLPRQFIMGLPRDLEEASLIGSTACYRSTMVSMHSRLNATRHCRVAVLSTATLRN